MTRRHPWPALIEMIASMAGLVLMVGLGGCAGSSQEPNAQELSKARTEFLLTQEPSEAITALDLREQEGGFESGDVVLVGRIGGMPNPWKETEGDFPWRKGEASFFLIDPSTAAEFEGHQHGEGENHEDCPFCARAAAENVDGVVAVTFNDANGQPLPYDARELFDLKENDVVVVAGKARILGGDLMVVDATGLYVRN